MNFQNSYKNQIDSVKPDGYIKDKVRRKLASGEKPKAKNSRTVIFRAAAAVALCAALVLSVGMVITNRNSGIKVKPTTQNLAMKTAVSYDSIYDNVKKFLPTFTDKVTSIINEFNFYGTKNSAVEEYYEVTEDTAAATGTSSQNTGAAATDDGADMSESPDHSETTAQVEGVDESDVVKTDGKYIYILKRYKGGTVKIVDIRSKNPVQLGSITADIYATDMYLSGDRLIIIGQVGTGNISTAASVYDVSDPAKVSLVTTCTQSGYLSDSRMISGKLYMISNYTINIGNVSKSKPETFVPKVSCENYDGAVKPDTVCFYNNCSDAQYTVAAAYDTKDGALVSTRSVLGGSFTVYASTGNIITASYSYNGKTQLARFAIDDGNIELKATGEIEGDLLNQFSIDEYKNHFRFVTTVYKQTETKESASGSVISEIVSVSTQMSNCLIILDGDLKETGKIANIAPDERVYSVRFMGDTAYFVTFRQVDPLFSVDVSDPKNPKIIGSLKIPGFSNYLFPFGDGKLLGIGRNADENTGRTSGMKLSMFDISDPSNVTEYAKTNVNSVYSEALESHKASLVNYKKNLIAFPAYGTNGIVYFVYSFENGTFLQKAVIETNSVDSIVCRGLYAGDVFYVATVDALQYFDLNTFNKLGVLELK